jgi:hypothetical protein
VRTFDGGPGSRRADGVEVLVAFTAEGIVRGGTSTGARLGRVVGFDCGMKFSVRDVEASVRDELFCTCACGRGTAPRQEKSVLFVIKSGRLGIEPPRSQRQRLPEAIPQLLLEKRCGLAWALESFSPESHFPRPSEGPPQSRSALLAPEEQFVKRRSRHHRSESCPPLVD